MAVTGYKSTSEVHVMDFWGFRDQLQKLKCPERLGSYAETFVKDDSLKEMEFEVLGILTM